MKTVRKGDTGEAVKLLQQRLAVKGYLTTPDGIFGAKTEEAVLQFQAAHGLVDDGIVGPNTWRLLLVETSLTPPANALAESRAALLAGVDAALGEGGVNAKAICAAAILDLGKEERPRGSNWGPSIEHLAVGQGYWDHWGIPPADRAHWPWCVTACMAWIGTAYGVTAKSAKADWLRHPFGAYLGGTQQVQDWAAKTKTWRQASDVPRVPPASLVTMGRSSSGSDPASLTGAGHTGMVLWDRGDGNLVTIEGNVDQGVRSMLRAKTAVRGVVLWENWRKTAYGN